jgi:hypothetical protein
LWSKTICYLLLYAFLTLQSTHADTLGFQELRVPAVSQVLRPQVLPEQALRVCLLQGRTNNFIPYQRDSKERCNVSQKARTRFLKRVTGRNVIISKWFHRSKQKLNFGFPSQKDNWKLWKP